MKAYPFLNQITLTSTTAAGSTSIFNEAVKHFSPLWRILSGGELMRIEAKNRGMTIGEMATFNLNNPRAGVDIKIDQELNIYSLTDRVFIESRLAHFTTRGATTKVFRDCPIDIRAERRLKQQKKEAQFFKEVRTEILKRDSDDETRYKRLYGQGCIWSPHQFDLVLSSEFLNPEELFQRILAKHAEIQKAILQMVSEDAGSTQLVSGPTFRPEFRMDYSRFITPSFVGETRR